MREKSTNSIYECKFEIVTILKNSRSIRNAKIIKEMTLSQLSSVNLEFTTAQASK